MSARLVRLCAAVAAGLLLWLAFPDHDLWWAPLPGVALFAAATWRVRGRTGIVLGLVTGLAFFLPTLSWSGVYVGAFPWAALAVLQSLYLAALGGVLGLLQRRRLAPTLGACAWVAQEWARSTTPFGGFPWARLAFSQADAPWAPLIAWVSAPGLTFVVAWAGGALAWLTLAAIRRARRSSAPAAPSPDDAWSPSSTAGASPVRSRPANPWGSGGHLTSAFAVVASALTLLTGTLITPPTSGRTIRVAGVQGNVPNAGLDFNAQRRAVLDNHVSATLQLADEVQTGHRARPDLVVWPENASDIDPKRNADAAREIGDALRRVDAPLVVGAVLAEPAPKVSNASMLYLPRRGLVATYVKQHPVPFGEYIPYRSFFRTFSKQVDLVRADFTQGRRVGLFTVPTHGGDVKLAPIICFEVAYDGLLRAPANRGAQLFAVQTNNATFGRTAESTQQLAISRLRALEYGRSVAHVSTVGVSALITPDGVAHQSTSLFTRQVLSGELPLRSHATPAQRLGRAPELAAASAVVIALGAMLVRRRKSSRRAVR